MLPHMDEEKASKREFLPATGPERGRRGGTAWSVPRQSRLVILRSAPIESSSSMRRSWPRLSLLSF